MDENGLHVKFCGITCLEDALTAVDAGADMLGFNFFTRSKRCITPEACADIQVGLQQHGVEVTTVGVFVNAPLEAIQGIMQTCTLDLAQLHGDESPQLLESLGESAFKAIRPRTLAEVSIAVQEYPPRRTPPALLVDAYHPEEYGGTGTTGDWRLAMDLASQVPVLLAGGLTAENIGEAVRQVDPWGVDVASGVETAPGRKDPGLMRAFVAAARRQKT